MDVDVALTADAANVSQEGKLNILGVFDTIWTRDFPFSHAAMVFVLRVRADFTEQGSHHLEVRLMDADGGQLFKAEGPFQVPGGAPGRPVKPHVILGLGGVTFQKPGDHSFEIMVDNQHLKSVPLYIIQSQPSRPAGKLA